MHMDKIIEDPEKEYYIEEKAIRLQKLLKLDLNTVRMSMVHRSIGALTFTNHRGGLGVATAILISKRILLTATHNLYTRDGKFSAEHKDFRFYLAPCGEAQHSYKIKSWKYLEEYKTCQPSKKYCLDYAIMELEESVEYENFCEIALTCQHQNCKIKELNKIELQIYGYPLHEQNYIPLDKHEKIQIYQFGLSKYGNVVRQIDYPNGMIYHEVSTEQGQSGCGVISKGNIIAIHVGAHVTQQLNIGRLVTSDVIVNIFRWCKQIKGGLPSINPNSICQEHHQSILKMIQDCKQDQQYKKRVQQVQFVQIPKQEQLEESCQQAIGGCQIDPSSLIEEKKILFRTAQNSFKNEKYEEALANYKKCLVYQQRQPNEKQGNPNIQTSYTFLRIGQIYLKQQKYKKAISSIQASIQIREEKKEKDPTYVYALYKLALVYMEKGDYLDAKKTFEKCQRFAQEIKQKQYIDLSKKRANQCKDIIESYMAQAKRLRKQLQG